MYYDELRNMYIDTETGDEIPMMEGDIAPPVEEQYRIPTLTALMTPVSAFTNPAKHAKKNKGPPPRSNSRLPGTNATSIQQTGTGGNGYFNERSVEQELYDIHSSGIELPDVNQTTVSSSAADGKLPIKEAEGEGNGEDWSLARTLQMMEFEIEADLEHEEDISRDFYNREISSTSLKKQFFTLSTLLCLLQIAVLITMIQDDGYAPGRINPMWGPPGTTMVRYGAKDAALILYKDEWWRLVSPVMLHAGIIHLFSNVAIQLRVGGYLNLVFGTWRWAIIYIMSGVFGNLLSCVVLPDSVGVGSSGALMGILAAWAMWILIRWHKVPEGNKGQRNCQLYVVTVSIVATLAMSFSGYVDWGAHVGGTIMGALLALIFLSHHIDDPNTRTLVTCLAFAAAGCLYIWAFFTLFFLTDPSKANFPLYEDNDDWKHFGKKEDEYR